MTGFRQRDRFLDAHGVGQRGARIPIPLFSSTPDTMPLQRIATVRDYTNYNLSGAKKQEDFSYTPGESPPLQRATDKVAGFSIMVRKGV